MLAAERYLRATCGAELRRKRVVAGMRSRAESLGGIDGNDIRPLEDLSQRLEPKGVDDDRGTERQIGVERNEVYAPLSQIDPDVQRPHPPAPSLWTCDVSHAGRGSSSGTWGDVSGPRCRRGRDLRL